MGQVIQGPWKKMSQKISEAVEHELIILAAVKEQMLARQTNRPTPVRT